MLRATERQPVASLVEFIASICSFASLFHQMKDRRMLEGGLELEFVYFKNFKPTWKYLVDLQEFTSLENLPGKYKLCRYCIVDTV